MTPELALPLQRTPAYRPTVVALSIGQIVCWAALYYAFTAFVLPMQRELGWSKPVLMGAYTTGLTVSAGLSFAVGAAIDRGHGRAIMTLGPLLGALGLALWAASSSIALLYAAWVVLGVAMAMTLYEPAFTIVTRLYPARFRQAVTAITLVGGFASTLCFPAVALLQAQFGWRAALAAIAAVLALTAALHAWVLVGASIAPPAPRSPSAQPVATDATPREAFATRAFWALATTFTSYTFVAGAMWAHMAPALADKGLGEGDALVVLVSIGPAQVAGRLVFALLGRRFALRHLGLATLAGMPLGCVLFALGQGLAALLVFALLFGMANGVATLVRGGLLPDYFGRAALGRIGGAMSGLAQLARAMSPLAAAWLLLLLPGYRELVLATALIALCGWIAFALAGRPARRPAA
jgi:MFS family permease